MRAYELMVILSPEVEDRAVEPSLSKFLEIVTNEGGSIDNAINNGYTVAWGGDVTEDGFTRRVSVSHTTSRRFVLWQVQTQTTGSNSLRTRRRRSSIHLV